MFLHRSSLKKSHQIQGYGWCCKVQLLPRALPYAHTALSDAELAEDVAGPMATVKPGTATAETTKPRATLTEAPGPAACGLGMRSVGGK
jgi:hypothetical protein